MFISGNTPIYKCIHSITYMHTFIQSVAVSY